MPQLGLTVPVGTVAIIMIVLAFKHFLADFLFQTSWMARGKEGRHHWIWPLTAHVLVHGVLTLVLALVVAPHLWWLALVDFVIHATIDRCKSVVGQIGAWNATQGAFWWLIGFDQFLHHVTNVYLATILISS